MSLDSKTMLLLLSALTGISRAQSSPASQATSRPLLKPPAPPFTSPENVYSGISGPGKPVVGTGAGGWRSNYEFLGYDGPDSKPGWKPLGQFASTGSAVKDGLIPSIKPIWDRNDGIELWRSTDLKSWDYVGLARSFDEQPAFILSKNRQSPRACDQKTLKQRTTNTAP